ncbi:HutD family protein [Thalassomonas actiniarum]|uniref:HutD family protein n=1 Tax=Thalassomonas actiniarum TaxID=485447 RepID=A0AAE9YQK9_9GAMM|nr:HutD family protein [Thalassomonas actiniarum]WDD99255.1 HutD family protein [Thalassomonas actiniarum]
MINIIPPSRFKSIPWKNGKGTTTELAINEGGTLADFDWRLSIASVVEDGDFSDFSGYLRNLILISGQGIELSHTLAGQINIDNLNRLLTFSTFDGASQTRGRLLDGGITDFNLMTKTGKYRVDVRTYLKPGQVDVPACDLCFVYALQGEINLTQQDIGLEQVIAENHLLQIIPLEQQVTLSGQQLIVIRLTNKI